VADDDLDLTNPLQGTLNDVIADGAVGFTFGLGAGLQPAVLAGLAAAIAPLARRLAGLVETERTDRRARTQAMWLVALDQASFGADDLLVSADSLIRAAEADPDRRHLCVSATRASEGSLYSERIVALGRALASGLLADETAVLDMEQQVVDALATLERPHLALLQRMSVWNDGHHRYTTVKTFSDEEIQEIAAPETSIATRLKATLEREGLLQRVTGTYPGIAGNPWNVSDFGLEVLTRLHVTITTN
jgi:hypothetical protein